MILIGIDPGTKTGICVYSKPTQKIINLRAEGIIVALDIVKAMASERQSIKVFVEDARKRKWFGDRSTQKLQGAGSVKRDCSIWEELLKTMQIQHEMIAPQRGLTKWDAETFQRTTGWDKRTNEHMRDAAMIVWGR